ncbi:hypothetical protein FAES_3376 [Fibrella aestuarina BUZ 2]|uniref:Uncharacterized protein n=1 Tax=Fibrella aestuarina BUZ 2 TaxID=1166018 RepID=I0KB81_9BACT|nr:hypothetical protein [Fibrella aestuarina]CCH01384.1 hypothetical protein FAES_3376 [Fibrella aestuarina BUZ 2]
MHNFSVEIRDNYNKAHQDVAYLKRLDEYDLNRVSEYAEEQWMQHVQMAVNLMEGSPNYAYPESYKNGREVEYWLGIEYQTQRCLKVRQEIERIRTSKTQTVNTSLDQSERDIEIWEYHLRNFIHKATRYNISAVFSEVRPNFVFSAYFQDDIIQARGLYENFKTGLRKVLTTSGVNTDMYGRTIQARFLPMCKQYDTWYTVNKEETQIFEQYNPYALMWNVVESTIDEIAVYFPSPVNSTTAKTAQKSEQVSVENTLKPYIRIKQDRIKQIQQQLGFDLDDENKKRLESLLNLEDLTEKIHTKTAAKVLGDYFRQVFEAGHINPKDYTKDQVGEWLTFWFVKTNGKSLKPSTFLTYLHMTDNNPKLAHDKITRIMYRK